MWASAHSLLPLWCDGCFFSKTHQPCMVTSLSAGCSGEWPDKSGLAPAPPAYVPCRQVRLVRSAEFWALGQKPLEGKQSFLWAAADFPTVTKWVVMTTFWRGLSEAQARLAKRRGLTLQPFLYPYLPHWLPLRRSKIMPQRNDHCNYVRWCLQVAYPPWEWPDQGSTVI